MKAHYKVTGYAMVPCLVEIDVEADSPTLAARKARVMFSRDKNRKRFLVSGGSDEGAVCDFEPSEVTRKPE